MNPIWVIVIYISILFILSEIALRFFGVSNHESSLNLTGCFVKRSDATR